ncbi:thiol-disulfide oxidoreductase DCC family protein [Arenicella sp. 4NH20-0111]|uniref:thiol-disulfide oxidoreductase DCC family protein n=1 Tax=Arenicella sp. 4NH20-0111 TaxID=3127648 RepID=UPI003104E92A
MPEQHLIVFDDVCKFCNGAVNFIIKRDPDALFVFTPTQSDLAQAKYQEHKIDNIGIDTFLLIKNNECYLFSKAVLEIAKDVNGLWYLFGIFKIIPTPIRDYFYTLFGSHDECMIPSQENRHRFVDR